MRISFCIMAVVVGMNMPSLQAGPIQEAESRIQWIEKNTPAEAKGLPDFSLAPALEPISTEIRSPFVEKRELHSVEALEYGGSSEAIFFKIDHANAVDIEKLLTHPSYRCLTKQGKIIVDERTNSIWLKDTDEVVAQVQSLIKAWDVPVRQVLIESKIVIVHEDLEQALGVRFGSAHQNPAVAGQVLKGLHVNLPRTLAGGSSASVGFSVARLPGDLILDLELMALESEGLGQIISSPRLITSHRQKAYIESGEEIPYQETTVSGTSAISFKKAVLRLEVVPQITANNEIILDLTVSQDSRGEETAGVPSINKQEVQTQVRMIDGETVVLGGIYQQIKKQEATRVPWLGKIPLLKYLFGSQKKLDKRSQLMIFVTPQIIPLAAET